jgi:glycosyltransferase involved in cell wall biosynthesis
MRPIRALHVLDSFSFGGAEQLVASLGAHPSPGLEVRAASLAPTGLGRDAMLPRLEAAGLRPVHLGVRRLLDAPGLSRLVGQLRRSGADVVHAHLGYAATVVPLAARLAGIPCVATLHHVPEDLPRGEWFKERMSVRVPTRLGRLVFVSQYAKDEFARRHGPAQDSWRVIHNAVDLDRFRPPEHPTERPPTWLALAALRAPKGHDDLLHAWAKVSAAHPGAHLLVAGDGPQADHLRDLVVRLGLRDRVELLGARDDVPELLRQVDGVVSASHTEALPTALIEAAASGLPVVATAVGGTAEVVVDGVTGRLVPAHKPDRLADALAALVDDPASRARMGDAARHHAQDHFGMSRWVDQLTDLYTEVLGTRSKERTP